MLRRVADPRFRAVQKLARGVHRFRANYFASNKKLFERLARDGQRPETLFITCSDSRVVPNLITSTEPGELFLIRNVGNIVPAVSRGMIGGVAAAIQYAVEVLDIENIVICGHTNCGAMEAIMHPERVAHLPFISRWLSESSAIPRLIAEKYADLSPEDRLVAAVQENVLVQLENLRTYDFVSSRLDAGRIKIGAWVFKIATGQVFEYDPSSEQFLVVGGEDEPRAALSSRPPPMPRFPPE